MPRWAPAGTTSCWPPSSAPPYEEHEGGASPAYIRTAVEDSLSRLGTDRIDLYQQHVPDPKTPIAETIGVLGELVAEGKIREFGCSNFTAAMLDGGRRGHAAGGPGFVSVQNQYNILYREPEDGVLEFCDRTGTAFLPYFPLASGLLSGKYRAGEPPPEGTRLAAMGDRAASQLTDERLAAVAALDELAGGRATACSTWPSVGCWRARPWPRSSPAPPGPSRSPPTSPPARGARARASSPRSTPSRRVRSRGLRSLAVRAAPRRRTRLRPRRARTGATWTSRL